MRWRPTLGSGNLRKNLQAGAVVLMSPESFLTGILSSDSFQSFMALLIGFAFAGLLASGFQYFTEQPPSFRLINRGPSTAALMAFLIFSAPFIIMRNTIRGARIEGRSFGFAMLATVLAGLWSLMSGTVVVMALEASRIIH
jgi:hypothetical protein